VSKEKIAIFKKVHFTLVDFELKQKTLEVKQICSSYTSTSKCMKVSYDVHHLSSPFITGGHPNEKRHTKNLPVEVRTYF
jgi:hypothetical protein